MSGTPLLFVGDFPDQETGLSRILSEIYHRVGPALGDVFDVRACGFVPWKGLPREGLRQTDRRWAFSNMDAVADAIIAAYRSFYGDREGILFSCWDPSRCLAVVTAAETLPVKTWGYFAVDGENLRGRIPGGPATEAVSRYDRVLGYTAYGAVRLGLSVAEGRTPMPEVAGLVPHLPHGIDRSVFHPRLTENELSWSRGMLPDEGMLLGCVATNQRRKDLSLYFRTLARLRQTDYPTLRGWLHTDAMVADAWSVPQLCLDCGIPQSAITVTTNLDSRKLAVLYSRCIATLAPGRGEGWGYPIIESLACGAPVAHVDYAGGGEITPEGWRIPWTIAQPEGPFAVLRPVIELSETVEVVRKIIRVRLEGFQSGFDPIGVGCVDATEKYDWATIWPAWENWFREGRQV